MKTESEKIVSVELEPILGSRKEDRWKDVQVGQTVTRGDGD